MPIFIVLCLGLSYLVETDNAFQNLLISSPVIYISVAIAIISTLCLFFNKLSEKVCYDLFFSSTLVVWFASWKPLFIEDSPIFFFFPIYFALATALASLLFIEQRHKIDRQTSDYMRAFVEKSGMEPWILMALVLGSLGLEGHYLLFPVLMTILLVRYTLSGCLQRS